MPFVLTRREALAALGGGIAALAGCSPWSTETVSVNDGRIAARPGAASNPPPTGVSVLPETLGVAGLVFVPSTYDPATPAPAGLLLHGAGQRADELMTPISELAEARGLLLVAINSFDSTWDLLHGFFARDAKNADMALGWLFSKCAVDPTRVGVLGFSDGATYSLGLGRVNGDLFRRVIAYSPGYLANVEQTGRPEFFISHGTRDGVLPISNTRNSTVPRLIDAGYVVQYREFDGGHTVTDALLVESIDWLVRKS